MFYVAASINHDSELAEGYRREIGSSCRVLELQQRTKVLYSRGPVLQ